MLHFSKWTIGLILTVCLSALYISLPNINALKEGILGQALPEKTLHLGLDLQGGSYLLLEVDTNVYIHDQLETLSSDIRAAFRGKKVDGKRIYYTGGIKVGRDALSIALKDPAIASGVSRVIRGISKDLDVQDDDGTLRISYTDKAYDQMVRNVLDQSIEIVRRRVDETGTREPDIQRQGESRILLQVPGLKDPGQLKRLLGKTAKLSFHMVADNVPASGILPPGVMRLRDEDKRSYSIYKQVMISGDQLAGASPGYNQYNQPVVNIRFNSLGAKKFADVTRANVGKPFAIVLDKKVLTAPVIRTAILGGAAEISGNFTTESANDLAILLRAGALPAPLKIIEERTVGASLGADSIAAGKMAVILGIVAVVVFMLLSYGLFGVFSNVALLINIILVIAVLTLLQATLTLPGIAGIALTVGMAVDANVLIFERIREEVRLGKTPFAAIDNGFKQAFVTIADSNITTLLAAILLYAFGSGPVKGFAVTLSVGILTSMFSAILLTRFMVVTWLRKKRPSVLPL
jgi:preprotein translocase subunit SecD